ncbi:MAG: phosphotransferase [Prolixibacteraceae bacterium]|nr:phosphotransferase [Prolixibacteraceae bacterium]
MNLKDTKYKLAELFEAYTGHQAAQMDQLPGSGSDRIYFRLRKDEISLIGAYHHDIRENEAFFSFTKTFTELKINVPKLLAIHPDRMHYLLSDLGDETLYDRIRKKHLSKEERPALCVIKKALKQLIEVQINGGKNIDFSQCYPREAFDRQSITWDLNYFKYSFLKLTGTPFDEQALEDDFQTLCNFLLEAPSDFFMFRDFQARNIMVVDNTPWLIDYQGGRRGPMQYDLASLLYSPKTGLTDVKKELLLDYYLTHLSKFLPVDAPSFKKHYYGFVLVRILQAMGAYGFRGISERKRDFRNSIPQAIDNLNKLFEHEQLAINLPAIHQIAQHLKLSVWAEAVEVKTEGLTIRITSFSYKKGIPDDPSENGGGFVFDCRGLPNPGRFPEYRSSSGLDNKVKDYLEQYQQVLDFQEQVRAMAAISIKEYLNRGFNHLCVNFGCTGGQHRSVYQAEKFAEWVKNNFEVEVVIIHTEKMNWKKDG